MILRDEITNDPLGRGYAQMTNAEVEVSLNAKDRTKIGGVMRNKFAIWAASTGVRAKIEDASTNMLDPLRSSALALLDFLRGGVSDNLDLSDAANMAMLDAWVAAGKVTAQQKADLVALATIECSRAEELDVRADDYTIRVARS